MKPAPAIAAILALVSLPLHGQKLGASLRGDDGSLLPFARYPAIMTRSE